MAPLDGNAPSTDIDTDALVAAASQPADPFEDIERTAALMTLARAMNAARYAEEMDVDPLMNLARRLGRAASGSIEERAAITARLLCVMTDNERSAFFDRIAPAYSQGTAADWAEAAVNLADDIVLPLISIEFDRLDDWMESIGDDDEERSASAARLLDLMETRHDDADGHDRTQRYVAWLAESALIRMRDARTEATKAGDDVVFGKAITTRITDHAWLARHVRRWRRAVTIHLGDVLRQVGGTHKYLAEDTAALCRRAEQRCAEFLANAVAVSDKGGAARLSQLYQRATNRRMATAYALIHAMDEYRRMLDPDYVAVFVTLTCPGESVPLSRNEDKRRSKYSPRKWHFEARKVYLSVNWHGRVLTPLAAYVKRRGRQLFGIWTHEGTKAGVPHKHILLYLHKDDVPHLYRLVTGGDVPEAEFNPTTDAVLDGCGGARLGKHAADWHVGPYRVDIAKDENTGAFAASRVNIRVLQEKSEENKALASITSYVMKYVRKNSKFDALCPENTSDEARFARAHGMRTYGFFGLPKGIGGLWSTLAVNKHAPKGSLIRQIGDLIRDRKDGQALRLLIENSIAWGEVEAALRRLETAKKKGCKVRKKTLARLNEIIANRPDAALIRVSEGRITRFGGVYAATTGREEIKGEDALSMKRARIVGAPPPKVTPEFSTVKTDNWTITMSDSVLPLVERHEDPPEAAIDAAKAAVAEAIAERNTRRPVEGGYQPDGATSAAWFREAMNAALGLKPGILRVRGRRVALVPDLHESSRGPFGMPSGPPGRPTEVAGAAT